MEKSSKNRVGETDDKPTRNFNKRNNRKYK